MGLIIGVISQKGGVGKSTIARTIAKAYAQADWNVLIADLDTKQGTTFEWNTRRLDAGLLPELQVQQFSSVASTLRVKDNYDLIVYDGAPHSTSDTLAIAQISNLIILPTGGSLDDLQPQIRLAHELVNRHVDKKRIAFVLSRVDASGAEHSETVKYLEQTPYKIIDSYIPEKRAFRNALNEGKTLTDTNFKSLNHRVDQCVQAIVDYANYII